MSGFTCPYCNKVMSLTSSTIQNRYTSFEEHDETYYSINNKKYHYSAMNIIFRKCPSCEKYTISAMGLGTSVEGVNVPIVPKSSAKQYPEYIPEVIRNDYEEAYAIIDLSPKSSATLSRRCLQGMIRDFWKVKKNRLVDEIDAIKDNVSPTQWKVIDGVRRLGNIGAHMEKDINLIIDIDPNEAYKLLKLIEILIEQWYINRFEQEQLYQDILDIDADKQSARKGNN